MTPENKAKRAFIAALPDTCHAQTIETTTGRGVPDLNVCGRDIGQFPAEWWFEFKCGGLRPKLRPEQYAWSTRRTMAGGNVAVLHLDKHGIWHVHLFTSGPGVVPGSGRLLEIVSEPFFSSNDVHRVVKQFFTS